jgi:hypothetical protein
MGVFSMSQATDKSRNDNLTHEERKRQDPFFKAFCDAIHQSIYVVRERKIGSRVYIEHIYPEEEKHTP